MNVHYYQSSSNKKIIKNKTLFHLPQHVPNDKVGL